tara:strand:+ start:356 stop:532 length:177 start_codon:yes stop_codon:yes gene_type:complete
MNEIKFHKLLERCGLNTPQASQYLEVNKRTIKRWRNGETIPPISVIRDLEQLAESKEK